MCIIDVKIGVTDEVFALILEMMAFARARLDMGVPTVLRVNDPFAVMSTCAVICNSILYVH